MTEEEQNKLHAYHEAGHAVAGFIFHIPIIKVSLKDKLTERETLGEFDKKDFCTDWKTRERFMGLIVNAYSGYCAAVRIDKKAAFMNPTDQEFAIKYSELVYPNDERAAYQLRDLSELIALGLSHAPKYWYAIKALAEKLLEKPCIPGEEAESIIENAITGVL